MYVNAQSRPLSQRQALQTQRSLGPKLNRGRTAWRLVRSADTASVRTAGTKALETSTQEEQSSTVNAKDAVDRMLELIKDTDAGLSISPANAMEVGKLIDVLEAEGTKQGPPLENPLLWGNYTVAYTANGPRQYGQAAGGRFRSAVGRNLFKTTGLFQSVYESKIATNKVAFSLFGLIPGFVGLRGRVIPVEERPETVQVDFDAPVLALGDKLFLRIGPPSSVVLSTTYLDEHVRLGKGIRGSRFVFTRTQEANEAGMEVVGLQKTTTAAAVAATLGFLGLFALGGLMWWTGHPLGKAGAAALWALGAFIGAVVRQGGIIRDGADDVAQLRNEVREEKLRKERAQAVQVLAEMEEEEAKAKQQRQQEQQEQAVAPMTA